MVTLEARPKHTSNAGLLSPKLRLGETSVLDLRVSQHVLISGQIAHSSRGSAGTLGCEVLLRAWCGAAWAS